MNFDTNNHSVFILHYHLIMCIKYRNKVINDEISNRLKEIFGYIAPNYNITLEEWNHDADHVHILFRGQPNTNISKFINAYKSASSRLIKKEYPTIKKSLWKEMFWSQSYCLISTCGVTVDVIKQYIQTLFYFKRNRLTYTFTSELLRLIEVGASCFNHYCLANTKMYC